MADEAGKEMNDAELDAFLKTSLLGPPTYSRLVEKVVHDAARPISTKEIVLAIEQGGQKAGTARRLIMGNVSVVLNKHPERFRRVCHGLYETAS